MARRSSTIRDIRANALDKQAESAKMSTVYTTAKINQILDDIKKGKKPDLNPFYHGKKDLRDSGITFERTQEEDDEYKKCALDPIYFVANYVKFRNDKGFTIVKLRAYQEDVLHLMADEVWDPEINDVMFKNRKVILLQSRQTGKCLTKYLKTENTIQMIAMIVLTRLTMKTLKQENNMEEKIRKLLKRYGADDKEIENFMNDLANYVEEKVGDIFDEDEDGDFEI